MDNSACMAMARVAQAIVYNNCKAPRGGYCAGYTSRMAYAFVNGKYRDTGFGDMGKQAYYDGIVSLGYTMVEYEPSISKSELVRKLAAHTNWFAGSVACYRGLDGSGSQNDYGHTQFYLGDGAWTCDVTDNYGTCFVYNNRNSTVYDFRLFKPNNEPSVCVEGNYCLPGPTITGDLNSKVERIIKWSCENNKPKQQRSYSKVTANAFVNASSQYNLDISFMLAVAHYESHCGCGDLAQRTNSIFSQGLWSDGSIHTTFNTMDESVYGFAKLITRDYLVNGKTVDDFMKRGGFVNYQGKRYATEPNYETTLCKIRNAIINKLQH